MIRGIVSTFFMSVLLMPSSAEEMSARLVNGTAEAGRLEIFFDGEWSTVCEQGFGKEDALVVCKMLGFNSTEAEPVSPARYGAGSGSILFDNLGCRGTETSLAECQHGAYYSHSCNHQQDVGVICNIAQQMQIRLSNGTSNSGRLEIFLGGEWSTVCDGSFEKEDAVVACRMLGFNSTAAAAVSSGRYGPGSGRILLDDVGCRGTESSLTQCTHNGLYKHDCGHSEDVGVICITSEDMTVRLVNGTAEAGRLEIFFNGEWNTVCEQGFGKEDALVVCRMLGFNRTESTPVSSARFGEGSGRILFENVGCRGMETSVAECQHGPYYSSSCNHQQDVGVVCNAGKDSTKARLVNGTSQAGRLEIIFSGEWSTVCQDNFGKEDALVACRMLGFNSTAAAAVSSGRYGKGSGRILLDDVGCLGNESSLTQCPHNGLYKHDCGHSQDVGVICLTSEEMTARLVNGTADAGRLEIFFNGEWSTVCERGFGREDALVACRMLGFNSTESTPVSSARFGEGSGRILYENVGCRGTETSLAECQHGPYYSSSCNHQQDVGVVCNADQAKARLVNGTSQAGRLEVFFSGEWSTVCQDNFGKEDALVACRMLGFNSTSAAAVSPRKYGQGSGRILLDDVGCLGNESSLTQCPHNGLYKHNCQHSQDVGVICMTSEDMTPRLVNGTAEAGRLEIFFNGEWNTVCEWSFGKEDALVACRMLGFNSSEAAAVSSVRYGAGSETILFENLECRGTETSLAQCQHGLSYSHYCGHQQDVGVICNAAGQITARLVNGTSEAGRLEIFFNGEWSTVCERGFGREDALVACRMLGFNGTEAASVGPAMYGSGTGTILLENPGCSGTETSLAQCKHGTYYIRSCNHQQDVGVICNVAQQMQIRLSNGTSNSGRLEIFLGGEWSTVCDDSFEKEDAVVACRMLGFNSTAAAVVSSGRYGPGSGRILLDDVGCRGTESSLTQCTHNGLYKHDCGHSEDVGVICITSEDTTARLVNGTAEAGRLEIFFNGEWNTVCERGFGKEDALVVCRMLGFNSTEVAPVSSPRFGEGSGKILYENVECRGTETSLAECQHGPYYSSSCNHRRDVGVVCNADKTKARLVNGTSQAGRLEVFFSGEWSTVCQDNFGKEDALVACRMLGFNSISAAAVSSRKYGQGSGGILFDDVGCLGNESSLTQCPYNGLYKHNCEHSQHVGVICNSYEDMTARLVNGTAEAGRLEIFFNGEWNTVCEQGFGKEDALVSCRMLGFNSSEAAAVSSDRYGAGSDTILFDNLGCRGTETSLSQCQHGLYYSQSCGHQQDVGVICNAAGQMTARLVNGTSETGRLEIFFNGEWSTVCERGFGREDALVACRMLGFHGSEAAVVSSDRYGAGSDTILFDNLECRGTETSLAQCQHGPYYSHSCGHQQDVGVICNAAGQMTARLVNGTSEAGRLEIFFDGEWSTVCERGFGREDALVACRMLGFNGTEAASVGSAMYGSGTGAILLENLGCSGTETSLAQCQHGTYYSRSCNHQQDVGVICNVAQQMQVRLSNGTSNSGRLEIFLGGEWSTVCDDSFEKEDAVVACRMLGFKSTAAEAVSSGRYGPGSGRILLDDVGCRGTESSLTQCTHNGLYKHNCGHSEDVGVICLTSEDMTVRVVNGTAEAGRLEIFFNGEWNTVCEWGFGKQDALVVCRMLGFNSTEVAPVSSARFGEGSGRILYVNVGCRGTETSLAECQHGPYYSSSCNHQQDVGVVCNVDQTKARLVNGTSQAGRLEVFLTGEWSTVCQDNFGKEDALVACRMLGLNSTSAAAVSPRKYGQGSGRILLDDVGCRGNESSLTQCPHNGLYKHNCGHSEDVGVICITYKDMTVRLVNGTSEAGRLEIFFNEEWSTVCARGFGRKDALVACRMLGFNSSEAAVVSSVRYGAGSDTILFDNLECWGTETSLTQCQHGPYYSHSCGHQQDVGVICNAAGQMTARLVNGTSQTGRLEIFFNGEWSTVCEQGFGRGDALVACRMLGFNGTEAVSVGSAMYGSGTGTILIENLGCSGTEISLAQCQHGTYYSRSCNHQQDVGVICNVDQQMKIRLSNGTSNSGRLEIFLGGEWSTVCDDSFEKEDAVVACRMLGFNSTAAAVLSSGRYGPGSGRILLDDVGCRGTESSLTQCTHNVLYKHDCGHYQDVGVICLTSEDTTARLVNGTAEAGRLEIFFNGEWNTVCEQGFGKEDALVVCRMLGFNSTEVAPVSSARFGKGSGRILYKNVGCRGTETSLAECQHGPYYSSSCNHQQDVGVVCNAGKDQTKARLVNGTSQAGRLEIFFIGEWSSVCNDNFGKEDALVACRMLGFNSTSAAAVSSRKYGQGSGRILLDDVGCRGNESSLTQCPHGGLYKHNCGHSQDVGVICITSEDMTARLVNGTAEAGRLEIFFNGEWNTVCEQGFGKEDALVSCRTLGFNSSEAAVVSSVRYGAGSDTILFNNLGCRGTETSLAQCQHGPYYSHSCGHHQDVGVICNAAGQMTARLVNGTSEAGRLEIFFNGEWSTVCERGFGREDALVACRMLGFNGTEAASVGSAMYGSGTGTILFENLRCSGTETSLAQCQQGTYYIRSCNHQQDVGVICNVAQQMKIRLSNGTSNSGRLEIFLGGEWSTVCDDSFEKKDAVVVCKMLGFNSTAAVVVSSAGYGPGSGRILLDGVECQGTESSLTQCTHNGWYKHDCGHSEDVGVICLASEDTTARLVNGTSEAGRLEIFFNGEWNTVCEQGFGKEDALVVCRMLGFNSTEVAPVSSARFGEGSGRILYENVGCQGTETSLAECQHGPYYSSSCNHQQDVGIVCNVGKDKTKARLVNGTSQAGRLEIFFSGEWSTVCQDNFGKEDALVACRMLGFNSTSAAAVSPRKYGQGSGRILLDDVGCGGTESSLTRCTHNGLYKHNCGHSEDVGVICITSEDMTVRLVNGTAEAGRLEIFFNGEWNTVCEQGFGKEDALVSCRTLGFNSSEAAAVSSVRYGAGSDTILFDNLECRGTETSLAQCQHGPYYRHSCDHQQDVGVICNAAGQMTARLVNGTSEAGRLEIFFNGEWSTVCEQGFWKNDALVACRMLGFNDTEAAFVGSAMYGSGTGTILFENLGCSGTETSLAQCQHGNYYIHSCNHQQDVGVICNVAQQMQVRLSNGTSNSGRLEIFLGGEWSTVCDDSFEKEDAVVACRMLGFNSTAAAVLSSGRYGQGSGRILLDDVGCRGTESSLTQCTHNGLYKHNCGHSEDVGVICLTSVDTTVRLVNGTAEAGRLEIFFTGEWNTVCEQGFGKEDVLVVCRMLGFNSTEVAPVSSATFGEGSGRILYENVGCRGTETSLAECQHGPYYSSSCNHQQDVGVVCNVGKDQRKARLVNGTSQAGRLEIFFSGEWSTVCQDNFGKEDALVACRMLGFNSTAAVAVSSGRYGQGSGRILLDDLGCLGNESSLTQCLHNGLYKHNCRHFKDVGVVCITSEVMTARLVNGTAEAGRLEIFFNGEWSTVCERGFGRKDALVACRMLGFNSTVSTPVSSARFGEGSGRVLLQNVGCRGTETSLAECQSGLYYPRSCSHQEDVGVICKPDQAKARLVNGTSQAGRLEIFFSGEWSTVCQDNFGKEEALVACRMLGFDSTSAAAVSSARYGQGSGQILLDDVQCHGKESSLTQCSHSGLYKHNCRHAQDVGVVCNTSEDMTARLVNGTLEEGRLEINFDGEWSTVCEQGFGKEEALVACRMLGFNSSEATAVSSVRYGEGSGTILFDNLRCRGTETSLAQCQHGLYYSQSCGHKQDVGVICKAAGQMTARLVNGTSEAGRLEIFFNGEWSTVCEQGFWKNDALVACRMLGFNDTTAEFVGSAIYGSGTGTILFENLGCSGTETSLAQCQHGTYYSRSCDNQQDVGVICNVDRQTKARLVNGTSTAGRLEIFVGGEWSTVCDDKFGKENALVACRMLGFNSTAAVAVRSGRYGQGSGQILLGDVWCRGTESSLTQCQHGGLYRHNCGHSQDVGVICITSEEMTARLVNGTAEAGRLEIFFNGEWNTVCARGFGNEDALVACRVLGFNSIRAMPVVSVRYGAGTGAILFDNLGCRGTETSLTECPHGPYYSHSCGHQEDVGVICTMAAITSPSDIESKLDGVGETSSQTGQSGNCTTREESSSLCEKIDSVEAEVIRNRERIDMLEADNQLLRTRGREEAPITSPSDIESKLDGVGETSSQTGQSGNCTTREESSSLWEKIGSVEAEVIRNRERIDMLEAYNQLLRTRLAEFAGKLD